MGFGGEYGGIGSDAHIWTWRVRGSVPLLSKLIASPLRSDAERRSLRRSRPRQLLGLIGPIKHTAAILRKAGQCLRAILRPVEQTNRTAHEHEVIVWRAPVVQP